MLLLEELWKWVIHGSLQASEEDKNVTKLKLSLVNISTVRHNLSHLMNSTANCICLITVIYFCIQYLLSMKMRNAMDL